MSVKLMMRFRPECFRGSWGKLIPSFRMKIVVMGYLIFEGKLRVDI
jgi:hypothetical protein